MDSLVFRQAGRQVEAAGRRAGCRAGGQVGRQAGRQVGRYASIGNDSNV